MNLDDINFKSGITHETIVTTLNPNNQPNAAAIGVQRIEGDKLKLIIFQGSNTFKNLITTDTFGINILETDQYALAVQAALKGWNDTEPEFKPPEYEFHNEIPFLKSSKCWILCKIDTSSIQDLSDEYGKTQVMEIISTVQDLIFHDKITVPLTRSDDLPILEAAVLATRYKVASGEKQQKIKIQIEKLINQTYENNDLELIDLITQFIEKSNFN
jgi:hypothetical protein